MNEREILIGVWATSQFISPSLNGGPLFSLKSTLTSGDIQVLWLVLVAVVACTFGLSYEIGRGDSVIES
jgi:hypothetical protein